ncbi:MAG: AAA family ATPase [Oscillospiraceae bacterium]|nr:AAA family ATPase [Oscillospiraceae bacterium]
MKCGLLGRKLGHSYSPQIHTYLGSYSYDLFEREPEYVESFLKNGDFSAINVTIPYKKTVMPYCRLTPTAEYMGSVNTIVRQKDGSLLGHNTDYFGFTSMVRRSGLDPMGKKCLVLGSGGASVTAVAVLKEMGANVIVISRGGEDNYENLDRHMDAALICNCTPVGMYPSNGISPINLDLFPRLEGVLDMIYNPSRTKLLMDAENRGLIAINGLWMLVAQAKEAAEWFLDQKLPDSLIKSVYRKMQLQTENIILVGMPGCGKSTVGKALAAELSKEFVDADEELVKTFGRTIPDVFAEEGEAGFRKKETQILADLGKRSGLVIATGGGCVTKRENYPLLHQNGRILWLKRDIDLLPTEGRPLSQSNRLSEMYTIRKPLYEAFSDFSIDNNSSFHDTVSKIISILEEQV